MCIRIKYSGTILLALAAITIISASTASAAEGPLRWKFKVGDKLNYNMVQEMAMSLPQISMVMHQDIDMIWEVLGVNEQGEAVIRQKFDRLKMKMGGPVGFEYDSKSEAAPTGGAIKVAPMYKAMTEGEFEIVITARGEVKDVKIPDQVLSALKNSQGAAAMGDIATEDGFKKMIQKGALVLPEAAPKKGETWSTKVEVNNPALGKQTVETTYRYEGTKDVQGTKFAVIHPEIKMGLESNPQPAPKAGQPQQPAQQQPTQVKIKEQTSDGEVLFNIKEGRLHSTTLKQNVTIDASAGGQTTQLKLEQKIDVKVSLAGEKKSDDTTKPKASDEKAKK